MCYTNEQAKQVLGELEDVLVDFIATGIGGALLDSCPARFKAEKEYVKRIFLRILGGSKYDDILPPRKVAMDWKMCRKCESKCKLYYDYTQRR